jgi:hypothetical protein
MTDLANSFTSCKKLGLVVYSSINDSLYRLNSETHVPLLKA